MIVVMLLRNGILVVVLVNLMVDDVYVFILFVLFFGIYL